MALWFLWLVAQAFGTCPEPAVTEAAPVTDSTDRSVAFEGTAPSFSLPESDFGEWRVCGEIEAIEPHPERADVSVLVLGGASGGRVHVWHGPDAPAPVRIGDTLGVHLLVDQVQIHRVAHLTVIDGQGRLLQAYSEGGRTDYAPGWGIGIGDRIDAPSDPEADRTPAPTPGQPPPEARAYGYEMVFAFAGIVAKSRGDSRLLGTPSGRYVVRGGATRWTAGVRPPDTGNYSTFSIARLPDPPVVTPP